MPKSADPPPKPRRRAGNPDRERYREHISQQFQIGKLSHEEFSDLMDKVFAVVYLDELPPLIAELDPLPSLSASTEMATAGPSVAERDDQKRLKRMRVGVGLVLVLMSAFLAVGGIMIGAASAVGLETAAVLSLVFGLVIGLIGVPGSKRP